jgi:hypothetical protein
MMKYQTFVVAPCCWLFFSAAAVACINVYGTDGDGHAVMFPREHTSRIDRLRQATIDQNYWQEQATILSEDLETGDFKQRSDYAAALIYLGRADEAITILEEVEREHPDEYIVASNLGTAYELSGDVEKALHWIRKGYELNPTSHSGSEWLHVRILEAKLELASDPDWLKTHSVLGLDFGNDAAVTLPSETILGLSGAPLTMEEIISGVDYQLNERLKFVNPPDPIVGDLLFDLGNLVALAEVAEKAVPLYEFAEEYGVRDPTLTGRRVEHFRSLIAANVRSGTTDEVKTERVIIFLLILATVFSAFVGLAIFAIVRWRKSRRKATES